MRWPTAPPQPPVGQAQLQAGAGRGARTTVEVGKAVQRGETCGDCGQHHIARLLPAATDAHELGGDDRPSRVSVSPVQVATAQAAGHCVR